ncbi:hypothetical protein ABPG72_001829 [Tetrahymena utriculariae]
MDFEKEFTLSSESPQRNPIFSQTNQSTEKCALIDSCNNLQKNDGLKEIQIQSNFKEINQSNEIVTNDSQFQMKDELHQIQQEENQRLERDQDQSYDLEIQEKINYFLQPHILFHNLVSSSQSNTFQQNLFYIKEISLQNSQILENCSKNYQNMIKENQNQILTDLKYLIVVLKQYQKNFSNENCKNIQIVSTSYDQVFQIYAHFQNRFQQIQYLTKSVILDHLFQELMVKIQNSQNEMIDSQKNIKNMKQESQIYKWIQALNIIQESIFFSVIKKHIYEFTTEFEIMLSIEVLVSQIGTSQHEQETFFLVLFNFLQVLVVNKTEIESCKRFVLSLLNSNKIIQNKIGLHFLLDIIVFSLIQDQKYSEALNYLEIVIGIIKEGDNLDSLDFKKQIILIKFIIYVLQYQTISTIKSQYSKFQKVQQLIERDLNPEIQSFKDVRCRFTVLMMMDENEEYEYISELNQVQTTFYSTKFNELIEKLLQIDFYIILEPFGLMQNRSNIIKKQDFQMNQLLSGQQTKHSKSVYEMQIFQKFYSKLEKKKIEYMVEDRIDKLKYDIYIANTYQILDFEYYIKIQNYQDVLLDTSYGECVYSNLYLFKKHLSAIQSPNGYPYFCNYLPYTYFIDTKNWSIFIEGGAFNLNEMRKCFQSSQNKISEELFTYTLSKLLSFAIILNKNGLYYGNYSLETVSFFKQNSLYTLKINNYGCITSDYNSYFEIKTLYKFQKYCQIDFGKLTREQVLFAEIYNICMVVADLIIDDDKDFINLYQYMKQNFMKQQEQNQQEAQQQQGQQQKQYLEQVYKDFIKTITQKLKNKKEYYKNNLIDFLVEIINIESETSKISFEIHELESVLRRYDLIDQIEEKKSFKKDIEISEQLTTYIFQTTRFYQNQQYKTNLERCFTNYYLNYFSNEKIYLYFFQKALELNLRDTKSRYILDKLFIVQQYVCTLILNYPVNQIDQSFLKIFFQVSIKLLNTISKNQNNDNQKLKLLQEKLSPFQKIGSEISIEYNYRLLINIALQLNQYSFLEQLIYVDGISQQFEKDIKELSIKITSLIINNEVEEASSIFDQMNELIGQKLNIYQPIDIAYLFLLLFFSHSILKNVKFIMFYFEQYKQFNQRLLSKQQVINQDQYFKKIIFLMVYSKILYLLSFNKFEEALIRIQIMKQLQKYFYDNFCRELDVQYYINITQLEVLCRLNLKMQIHQQLLDLLRFKNFMSYEQRNKSYPLLFENIFNQLNGYMLPIVQLAYSQIQNEEQFFNKENNLPTNFIDERNNFNIDFSNYVLDQQKQQIIQYNEDFRRNKEENLKNKQNYLIESSKNQLFFDQAQTSRDSTQFYGFNREETLTYASLHKYFYKINNQKKKQEITQSSSESTENQSNQQNTINFSSQYKFVLQNSNNLKETAYTYKDQETISSAKYFKELNDQQIIKQQKLKDENRGSRQDQKYILQIQSLYDNKFENQNIGIPKNNYKLVKIRELGQGGFGSVSIYYDNVTRNKIDVKKYTCQLIDYNDYNYQLALEMGFSTLLEAAQMLNIQETGFSIPNLINFLNSMVCFCIELHKIKYYHGDIKPQNIIITINQNSSDFQQNFGICEFTEANIKFIDFGSFSNDVDCYYDYISAKYKCLFFEEIFEQQKLTWEQILFEEIYSCCKTIIYTMSQDLQNEYILLNKSQVDQQIHNQDQKLKLFDFLDIFLTYNPSQNNNLKYGITFQELIQLQQQYLIQNQAVLVQNYYQIDFIQKQIWKKIQTDDFVESQINNQFQQNMLRACSFRNKILNNKQLQLTPNQLNEYNLQDMLDNLFLLVFQFDLNQEEFYRVNINQ